MFDCLQDWFLLGGFLRKVINDTVSTISGSSPQKRKMFLYSAHDINVAGLLINLGIYTPHYPPYACYILIEVHEIANVHGIKVGEIMLFFRTVAFILANWMQKVN